MVLHPVLNCVNVIFLCFVGIIVLDAVSPFPYHNFDACKAEKSLFMREKQADFIITGTIFALTSADLAEAESKSRMWKGQVAVKRVIKGDAGQLQPLSVILVENFGDQRICDAAVVKRDTKIFLLTKNDATGNFRLNSSVVRVTLKNLDRISAIMKGQTVTTNRPPIPEVPCERTFCGRGSVCQINPLTGGAFCSETEDPCRHTQCLYGATCVGNYVTGRSECVCPSTCESFANVDLRPSVYVCGSDNVTYDSNCKLRLRSCQEQRPIQVESIGVCGGCQRKQCDFYATCEVDATGTPNCACPVKCSSDRKPVCGVDGVTYDNECELKKTACEQTRFIVVAAPIPCESIPSKLPSRSQDYEEIDDDEDSDETGWNWNSGGKVVQQTGHCDMCKAVGGTCSTLPNGMQCLCKFNCSLSQGSVVCGKSSTEDEEMKLFTNECFLREYACKQMKRITPLPAAECEEVDILPCYGLKPLRNNKTHEDLFCGDGVKSEKCPTGSYCHKSISTSFAKCCPQVSASSGDCTMTDYGCCPDGITSARGRNGQGCRRPMGAGGGRSTGEPCKCNKIGAVSTTCDAESHQCKCFPGVGGSRCDRCQPGFWGLQKTALLAKGCIPCACSNFGSVRQDCEQMTGRCVCKSGVLGIKCDKCPDGQVLQPSGCVSVDVYPMLPSSCGELLCHLGAICIQNNDHVQCVCNMTCKEHEAPQVICGSDGLTYASVCQLRLHACRRQMDVTVAAWGSCGEAGRNYITIAPVVVTLQADMKSYLDEEAISPAVRDREVPVEPSKRSEAQLGMPCTGHTNCAAKHSVCADKKCACKAGYDSIAEKSQCAKSSKKTTACTKTPCKNGGTCTEVAASSYECTCRPGFQGKHCQDESLATVPAFSGRSYFELRPVSGGYTQMTIELEFQSHLLDGIILYNGQKPDGSGDFVSLSLNNGYVEFRFDLGDGPAVIRSSVPIALEKRHRIIAKRFNQDGMLQLDGHPEVLGRCSGARKYLDLEDSLFVGYVPISNPSVFDKIGTKMGFVGCIYSMKVGKRYIGLTDPDFHDTIAAFEIGECGKSACASSPCQNGGTCEATSKGLQYLCKCSTGFSGHQCEVSSNCKNCQTSTRSVDGPENPVFVCADGSHKKNCNSGSPRSPAIPNFSGSSFVSLPRIADANPQFNLEMWFLTRSANGLLLYASQKQTVNGDFISLNLRHQKLEFVFDLGDGPINITHPDIVTLSSWHSVKVFRQGKRASVQLDSAPTVSSESQVYYTAPNRQARAEFLRITQYIAATGSLVELNLDTVTYIGGAKSSAVFSEDAKIESFFNGAVQMLSLNQKLWNDFERDAIETHKITPYIGPPCHQDHEQCLNGGMCIPRLAKFRCKCTPQFGGEKCEQEKRPHSTALAADQAVHFDGHIVLEYPNMITESQDSQEKNVYHFRLKTTARNGLILWQSKGKSIRGDFLSIAIVDGRAELAFDLGKEKDMFVVRSTIFVSDGKWHKVTAERKKRSGTLHVDDEKPLSGTSTPGTTALNTNGKLYIGGFTEMPTGFGTGYYQGFDGCLSDMSVNGKPVSLMANGTNGLQLCPDEEMD